MRPRPWFAWLLIALMAGACSRLLAQQSSEEFQNEEQQYAYAVGLSERHFYDLAAEQFLSFVRSYKGSGHGQQAWQHLIECYYKLDRAQEMEDAIAEYRRRWPDSKALGRLDMIEADSRYRRKDYAGAIACYNRILTSEDKTLAESAQYFLVQCLLKQEKKQEAIQLLYQLADRDFSHEFTYRFYAASQLAHILVEEKQIPAACLYLKRLAEHPATPDDILPDTLMLLGNAHYDLGNMKQAQTTYTVLIAKFPDIPNIREAYRFRLKAFYNLKEYDSVAKLAVDFGKRYPDDQDFEIDLMHAGSCLELKRYGEALMLFSQIGANETLPPKVRANSLVNAIKCMEMTGHYAELRKASPAFLEAFPNSSRKDEVLFAWGRTLFKEEAFEEAAEVLSNAVEASIGKDELFVPAGQWLAECYKRLEKWAAAAHCLVRVAERLPKEEAIPLRELAVDYDVRAGNVSAACSAIQELRRDNKGNTALNVRLLDRLFRSIHSPAKDYAAMRADLEEIIPLLDDGQCQEYAYWLALVDLELNDQTAALKTLSAAIARVQVWDDNSARNIVLALRLEIQEPQDKEADNHFTKLLEWSDETLSSRLDVENLAKFGNYLAGKEKFQSAERLLRLALAKASGGAKGQSAKVLAQLLLRVGRSEEAESILKTMTEGENEDLELKSLYAEVCLNKKEFRQAFVLVEDILRTPPFHDIRTLARAQWVKAVLLVEDEKDYKGALPLCLKNYVMLDDEVYSPRSMGLAIRILLKRRELAESRNVWVELQRRYPLYAAEIQNEEYVKALAIGEDKKEAL